MTNDNKNPAIAVIGGDLRQIRAAEYLMQAGYSVRIYGFDQYELPKDCFLADSLVQAVSGVDYVILPLPWSRDGVILNAPYSAEDIELEQIYASVMPWMTVLGGKIDCCSFADRGIRAIDYFAQESFQILNAVPTAEGAIQIAMEESPITISQSRCLVVGYGRIGKVLAQRLRGLHASVCVSARKSEDFAWIRASGYESIKTSDIRQRIGEFDFIFNTVPVRVISEAELQQVKRGALLIDLASAPGGIDMESAQKYGVQTVWSLSLPGKVAPDTAGKILSQVLADVIQETQR